MSRGSTQIVDPDDITSVMTLSVDDVITDVMSVMTSSTDNI